MEEYTEVEAYKHLLSVTENIILSLSTQQEILKKYETLKKSILSKIITKDSSHSTLLLDLYRDQIDSMLKCVTMFENEIEGEMSKSTFLSGVQPILAELNGKIGRAEKKVKGEKF